MTSEEYTKAVAAVELATNHVLKHRSDDIFRPPMFEMPWEHEVIVERKDAFTKEARKRALSFLKSASLDSSVVGRVFDIFVPKDQFTYRKVAWMDVFDSISYLSLAAYLFEKIEDSRVSKGEYVVHSHRQSDVIGDLFDEKFGYMSFRKESARRSSERVGQWKVVTDISNFFDRIGNHNLENHFRDIGCEEKYYKKVINLLLYWNGDRRSYGIPVGSDASRIISEVALVSVDRVLLERGLNFIRYVDDYRFFSETRAEAHDSIRILTELLAEEGLSINHKKTSISKIEGSADADDFEGDILHKTHEPINIDEKIIVRRKSVVSGKSSISKYYKKPGRDALKRLRKIDIGLIFVQMAELNGSEQESLIRDSVKYFIYINQDIEIIQRIIALKLTSVIYIIDAILKDADKIEEGIRAELKNMICNEVNYKVAGYRYLLSIVRLVGSSEYGDKEVLEYILNKNLEMGNSLFLREAIFLGYKNIKRKFLLNLSKKVYHESQPLLQMAIYFALVNTSAVSSDEKRPIIKNMKASSGDPFISGILSKPPKPPPPPAS